jgi:hypothetical protein
LSHLSPLHLLANNSYEGFALLAEEVGKFVVG